jgi:hypothetical protein
LLAKTFRNFGCALRLGMKPLVGEFTLNQPNLSVVPGQECLQLWSHMAAGWTFEIRELDNLKPRRGGPETVVS